MLQMFMLSIAIIGFSNFSYSSGKKNNYKSTRSIGRKLVARSQRNNQSSQSVVSESESLNTLINTRNLRVKDRYPDLTDQQDFHPYRTRGQYDPTKPYRFSRTQIQKFLDCQCCFYLKHKLNLKEKSQIPFSLNIAVDGLLKEEWNEYRKTKTIPPVCLENGVQAIPFDHPDMNTWQKSSHQGLQYQVPGTNLIACGGIDDALQDCRTKEIYFVDHKATATENDITTLDKPWHDDYKRQMDVYQYLGKKNGLPVSNKSYFPYSNAKKKGTPGTPAFNNQLNFTTNLIEYEGDSSWVEETVLAAYQLLQKKQIPPLSAWCQDCQIWKARTELVEQDRLSKRS